MPAGRQAGHNGIEIALHAAAIAEAVVGHEDAHRYEAISRRQRPSIAHMSPTGAIGTGSSC